jgi:hypothetical protein
MYQYEVVIKIMEENGGYATLNHLYQNVLKKPGFNSDAQNSFANIRRIVQQREEIFKIKPGLWALEDYRNRLPGQIAALIEEEKKGEKEFSHYYYQGLLVEIGNLKNFKTYIPPQDKNKPYLDKKLKDVSSLYKLLNFTYEEIVNRIKSIDVIWINNKCFPEAVFEVEHSTNFKNSLIKFSELSYFNANMQIVAPKERKNHFKEVLRLDIFENIKERVKFWDYDTLEEYYASVSKAMILEKRCNLKFIKEILLNNKYYIFLTSEGTTFQPNSDAVLPDIENLQVIGFSAGKDSKEAYDNLLEENPYLLKTNFDEIFCYELDRDYKESKKYFYLNSENLKKTKI